MLKNRFLLATLFVICFSSGCVVERRITDVWAHEKLNNYKVQTLSVHFALFSTWQQWDAWTCRKQDGQFLCTEIEHASHQMGRRPANQAVVEPSEETTDVPEPTPVEATPEAPSSENMNPTVDSTTSAGDSQ